MPAKRPVQPPLLIHTNMNKSAFTAILPLVATVTILSSCSQSPVDQGISLMEDIASILENTTTENADAMIKKISGLESRARGVAAVIETLDKDDIPKEKELEIQKALGHLMEARYKLGQTVDAKTQSRMDQAIDHILRLK